MRKPEITFENIDAVCEYYQENLPNPRIRALGYGLLQAAYHPRITFIGDAETQIHKHGEEGGRFILTSNHTSRHDQFTMAVTTTRVPGLDTINGRAVIPSKPQNFTLTNRALFEAMGATPIFREKDFNEMDPQPGRIEAGKATMRLLGIVTDRMNEHGYHAGIFPEGERNLTDKRNVQDLQAAGLTRMINRLDPEANGAVVPMAFRYRGTRLRPDVAIGEPLFVEDRNGAQIVQALGPAIQLCVDATYKT